MKGFLLFSVMLVLLCYLAENVVGSNGTSTKPPKVVVNCFKYNSSCGDCIATKKCYFCRTNKVCWKYDPTIKDFIPPDTQCQKSDSFLGQCFFSTLILLIVVPSVAGVLLIALGCTIYCCCCKGKKTADRYTVRFQRELDRRREAGEQRKAERQAKRDEIRRKYGLFKKADDSMYDRMA